MPTRRRSRRPCTENARHGAWANTGDSSQGYINIHDSSVLRGGSAGELCLQLGEDRRRELVELAGGQRDPVTFGKAEHRGLGLVLDDVVKLEDAGVVHQ